MNHSQRKHAICGASTASRWLQCPASIGLGLIAGPQPAGEAAMEGTRAHEMAERALHVWEKNNYQVLQSDESDAMTKHVMDYVRLCHQEFHQLVSASVRIEHKMSLHEPLSMFGTCDFAATGVSNECLMRGLTVGVVLDFKYGQSVKVDAKDNPQLAYYSACLMKNSQRDISWVKAIVFQPRMGGYDVTWWQVDELQSWYKRFVDGAQRAVYQAATKEYTYVPSDSACKWCPGKKICPALAPCQQPLSPAPQALPMVTA